jgi:hypothetical protein
MCGAFPIAFPIPQHTHAMLSPDPTLPSTCAPPAPPPRCPGNLSAAAANPCFLHPLTPALLPPPPPSVQAIGQQPYTAESQLEAFGGAGPGAASKAAGVAMAEQLGPTTTAFAVHTLGKMHGMRGHKAWVSPQHGTAWHGMAWHGMGKFTVMFELGPVQGAVNKTWGSLTGTFASPRLVLQNCYVVLLVCTALCMLLRTALWTACVLFVICCLWTACVDCCCRPLLRPTPALVPSYLPTTGLHTRECGTQGQGWRVPRPSRCAGSARVARGFNWY